MLRTALALTLSLSVSAPAFAQQPENKVWDSVTRIKDYVTQYDSGKATWMAKTGGKITLWSFAAYGAATAALAPVSENVWLLQKLRFYNVGKTKQATWLANRIKDGLGGTFAGVGLTLVTASALTYLAQHVWYGWLGHADQNAAMAADHQEWTKYFATRTAEEIYADTQKNPEMADRMVQLADALTEAK